VWDQTGAVPLLLSDGIRDFIFGPDGLPVEQVTGSTAQFLLHDQAGSTRAIANAGGTFVGTYTYGPYGQQLTHTGAASSPFGWAGQYTDATNGLVFLQARWYDPTTERFLSVDPLTAVTGEPYGYADDDPIDGSDPTGLICIMGHNPDGSCRGHDASNDAKVVAYGATVVGVAAAVVIAAPEAATLAALYVGIDATVAGTAMTGVGVAAGSAIVAASAGAASGGVSGAEWGMTVWLAGQEYVIASNGEYVPYDDVETQLAYQDLGNGMGMGVSKC
jgi:RHS repeat-associated protein